jgi:sortase A
MALELQTDESHWRRNLVIFFAILLLVVGGYVLFTVFSPLFDAPLVTGRDSQATLKKLEKSAGENGDRLYIPQINVDVAIAKGSNSSALEKGAWHRKPQNGDPVNGGNFVLSAHRFVMDITPEGTVTKSPFYNIDRLQIGDRLVVDYQDKRYEYEITKKYAVKPNATEIEAPSEKAKMTLYSCTLQGSSDGRDVIEAIPVTQRS